MKVIDAHIHCGIQKVRLPWELLKSYLEEAGIDGACLFAPVEDIYERDNPHFVDEPVWIATRRAANRYLLDIQNKNIGFYSYYFVWNDFDFTELLRGYRAIKWHRHEDEPLYTYSAPQCERFLQAAYSRRLPIVLEESLANTLYFVARVAGRCPIIIPHLGMLNGGFPALLAAGVWDNEAVYADTALAAGRDIDDFLARYGAERLIFGSDFPFGHPVFELRKITNLGLPVMEYQKIVYGNIASILGLGAT